MQQRLDAAEVNAFLDEVFPQIEGRVRAVEVSPGRLVARLAAGPQDLRPGGTVSGPAMFMLADAAFYMVTLSAIGREALTVTTSATINFLRKPEPGALIAEARILKLGRTLCVGDVMIRSEGGEAPVAMASLTYAIPPRSAVK